MSLQLVIYIPLCLYFNSSNFAKMSGTSSFTFHYVSILISLICTKFNVNEDIYIPLCLYFNHKRFNFKRYSKFIYIPLCLYFNAQRILATPCPMTFTFHYVSILILTAQLFLPVWVVHLHSIMSLF